MKMSSSHGLHTFVRLEKHEKEENHREGNGRNLAVIIIWFQFFVSLGFHQVGRKKFSFHFEEVYFSHGRSCRNSSFELRLK